MLVCHWAFPRSVSGNTFTFYVEEMLCKALCNVFSAVRDGTSNQCEVPRDPRFPECPGKVDVSASACYFHIS